jgi:hypothetical protein
MFALNPSRHKRSTATKSAHRIHMYDDNENHVSQLGQLECAVKYTIIYFMDSIAGAVTNDRPMMSSYVILLPT